MTKADPAPPVDTPMTGMDPQPATERGRRKRAAIVAAAREVFEECGFKDARIADIARKAGASYGSFYTYFDSKEEIFREVVHEVTDEMFAASRGAGKVEDPAERIERANRAYVESYARNARMMSVMSEVAAYDPFTADLVHAIRRRFVERITDGINRLKTAGSIDAGTDAEITADLLGGMIERFAQLWVQTRSQTEIDAAIPVLTQIWVRSLGVPDASGAATAR